MSGYKLGFPFFVVYLLVAPALELLLWVVLQGSDFIVVFFYVMLSAGFIIFAYLVLIIPVILQALLIRLILKYVTGYFFILGLSFLACGLISLAGSASIEIGGRFQHAFEITPWIRGFLMGAIPAPILIMVVGSLPRSRANSSSKANSPN